MDVSAYLSRRGCIPGRAYLKPRGCIPNRSLGAYLKACGRIPWGGHGREDAKITFGESAHLDVRRRR